LPAPGAWGSVEVMRILALALLSLLILATPAGAQGLDPDLAAIVPCLGAYKVGDYEQAAVCFRSLAEGGNPRAQGILGEMYDEGQGVPQNYAQAVVWYRKAAEQGDAGAQYNLGWMYDKGQGVPQDYAQAVAWYRKAAAQGVAEAQNNLGAMYGLGQGVPQNYEEAYVWFSLAAAQGYENAAKGRDAAASLLTPEALERAQARAAAEHARIHKARRD
jgi:TPR repeat protein